MSSERVTAGPYQPRVDTAIQELLLDTPNPASRPWRRSPLSLIEDVAIEGYEEELRRILPGGAPVHAIWGPPKRSDPHQLGGFLLPM